jgi:hypothetical protein
MNTATKTKALLEAALEYSRRGWSVMPVARGAKLPLDKWKKYQTELPTEKQIRDWWSVSPDMNVGLITGALSGVVILDVDGEEGQEEARRRGGIPFTPQVQSRPQRFHFYFRHPGFPVSNFAKKTKNKTELPGLDFRGDGGYALLPPSLHASGDVYHWIVSPDDAEFAEAPEWLLELLKSDEPDGGTFNRSTPGLNGHGSLAGGSFSAGGKSSYACAALEKELEILATTGEGSRNEQLNKSAFSLGTLIGAGALDESEVHCALENAARRAGLPDSEIKTTLASGLENGKKEPRILPEERPAPKLLRGAAARTYIETGREPETEGAADNDEGDDEIPLPYAIERNRIVFVIEKTNRQGETVTSANVVADFAAHIVEEIATEDDEVIYKIHVRTPFLGERRSLRREVEVTARQAADGRQLAAILSSVAGAQFPVRAGMEKHLPVALKHLSGDFAAAHRFTRTGWARVDGEELFLIPGRVPANVSIQLTRKLPYRASDADPSEKCLQEQKVLEHLLLAQRPAMSCVAVAFAFQAPLAHLMGWNNERYCCFISGRSGSLKTTWTQVLLSLYGVDFGLDEMLVKWGEGSTRVGIMTYATYAHDLPILLDNYKPNTGKGSTDFVNVIHNIVEGSDRDRGKKEGGLLESKIIQCWPLVTGEDVADSDAAGLARVLVVPFGRKKGPDEEEQLAAMTAAKDGAALLSTLGTQWLLWLQKEESRNEAKKIALEFDTRRLYWAKIIRKHQPDAVNPLRIASNLASNELTWRLLQQCPATAMVAGAYGEHHAAGLQEIAISMAHHTGTVLEAHRYLDALRELLATERCVLLNRGAMPTEQERDRLIGYHADDGAFLLPDAAMKAVLGHIGRDGLNNLSEHTIYRQLRENGAIASTNADSALKTVRIGGRTQRLLHLTQDAIYGSDGGENPV